MTFSLRNDGWILCSALGSFALTACALPGKDIGGVQDTGGESTEDDGPQSSGSGVAGSSTGGGQSSTSTAVTTGPPVGSTGEPVGSTGEPGGSTGEPGGSTGGPSPACEDIDHGACWASITESGNVQNASAATVAAFEECYGNPALPFSADRLVDACVAELDRDCLFGGDASCGATYCECSRGTDPFDWSYCYTIAMAACDAGSTFTGSPECLAILETAGCYQGVESSTIDACYEGVNTGRGNCACPMCTSDWGACEDSMDACVGA